MTQLLEQAFSELQKLPEHEQDALAERILENLIERRWDALFARPESDVLLGRLAAEALEDFRAGRTLEGDPSTR